MNLSPIQTCRYILGLSWVYHGLFPKLLTIAPIEKQMTAAIGFSDQASYLITKSAGVLEIVFGLALIVFYKNKTLLFANMFLLLGLCLFVAIQIPILLVEAFNPVTTNLSLIGLSYVLYKNNSQ